MLAAELDYARSAIQGLTRELQEQGLVQDSLQERVEEDDKDVAQLRQQVHLNTPK